MEEIFDVFDEGGNFLGIKPKSFCHGPNPNCYHKTVWIWIINSKNEVLIQKRAKCKKLFPSKWDNSCAGHIHAGEEILDACVRESSEEIGMNFSKEQFVFQGEVKLNSLNEFAQFFIVKADFLASETTLQEEEVEDVKWVTFDYLKSIIYTDIYAPHEEAAKSFILGMIERNLN